MLMWVIEGRLNEENKPEIDPTAITRYPLLVDVRDSWVTLSNYDGFKIKFIGSWDMPFASYRINTRLNGSGEVSGNATLVAVTNCDEIEFYGIGLKLVGMSEFKTGQMFVRGGTTLTQWPNAIQPEGIGMVKTTVTEDKVSVEFFDTSLKAGEHVYSILVVDDQGNPLPLYYTKNTSITQNSDGTIRLVELAIGEDENISTAAKYNILVDTYPVFVGE